jgi:hypothetical protein
MSLHVLAYNLRRIMATLGIGRLRKVLRPEGVSYAHPPPARSSFPSAFLHGLAS